MTDLFTYRLRRTPDHILLDLPNGTQAEIQVRRSDRARHLSLRIEPSMDGVELVLPRRVAFREGVAFVRSHRVWIQARLAELPERTAFANGTRFPLLGSPVTIRHRPEVRGAVWREGDELHVTGYAEHLPRRVQDWLRREARDQINWRARDRATQIGRSVGRITIRDTRSRWGSCAPNGNLSFSWRLVLAPEDVLDYLVAHEVAHLVEANHGPEFWALVESLCGQTATARAWLRRHGATLHRYG